MLTQVSGRAGRREKIGQVLIQTHSPEHPIIKAVIEQDYATFYANEEAERKSFHYPPFCRMIRIVMKHKDVGVLNIAANELAKKIRNYLDKAVLGPEFPLITKIKNYYIKTIILKIPLDKSVIKVKQMLQQQITDFYEQKVNRSVVVQVDVDPY